MGKGDFMIAGEVNGLLTAIDWAQEQGRLL